MLNDTYTRRKTLRIKQIGSFKRTKGVDQTYVVVHYLNVIWRGLVIGDTKEIEKIVFVFHSLWNWVITWFQTNMLIFQLD